MTGESEVQLLRWLHQTSGDLHTLDDYLESRYSRVLWEEVEDQLLWEGRHVPVGRLMSVKSAT